LWKFSDWLCFIENLETVRGSVCPIRQLLKWAGLVHS